MKRFLLAAVIGLTTTMGVAGITGSDPRPALPGQLQWYDYYFISVVAGFYGW